MMEELQKRKEEQLKEAAKREVGYTVVHRSILRYNRNVCTMYNECMYKLHNYLLVSIEAHYSV